MLRLNKLLNEVAYACRTYTKSLHTAEEYLALERSATIKSEFHMTGASRKHNLITVKIVREPSIQLKNCPCEACINDMRVKAAKAHSYHYPGIVVVCGTPQFEDAQSLAFYG